ncbi:unnamed protein product [Gordionus sp. m RMFG-2023]
MSLIPWSRGQLLVWDFTCIDPNAPSNHNVNALAESCKTKKYSSLVPSFLFIPIACTILTTFGSKAQRFFKDLGKRIREKPTSLRNPSSYAKDLLPPSLF